MKNWLVTFAVLGTLVSCADVVKSQPINAAKFGWLPDWNRGKAEARKTGKPIFLVFRCVP